MIRIAALFLVLAAVVYGQALDRQKCVGLENKAGVYLARVSTNCSLYDVCNGNMHLATMACGESLVFSNTYSICVYKGSPYDDCKSTGPTGGFYNDPLCRPNPNGLNIDPTDCSRYIPCFNMTSKPAMACQENLYFSFPQQRCMSMDKVDCQIKN